MSGQNSIAPQLTEAELRLTQTKRLGAVGVRRLREIFVSAEDAFAAGPPGWERAGIPRRLWPALKASSALDVSDTLRRIEDTAGWALSVFHPQYPPRLLAIHDPPPLLFGRGDVSALHHDSVAVVGSRGASRYGIEHGYRIARRLAEHGFTIISGLAFGVDATAHQAALDAGGETVAVLGSGISQIYPSVNVALAHKLCNHGALISECLPDVPAERIHFPRRNRIISGLSLAVVVVEAREDSGSLITAGEALDQGRDVFVVPGPAGGANRGGHRLLADGAGWAEDGDEIAAALNAVRRGDINIRASVGAPEVPLAWKPVWDALGDETRHIDSIIERSGLRSSDVLGILLQLELKGWVQQQKGKMFVRQV